MGQGLLLPPGGPGAQRCWRPSGAPEVLGEPAAPVCVCAHVCVHAGVYARVRVSQGPSVHGCVRAYLPLFLKILQSVHLARFKL